MACEPQVWMARALELAEKGLYTTHPNPRVGCVLVRDGLVVGEGWHERAGQAHAEVGALQMAGDAAKGADAYVTLEPCSHFGRTPPCADALVRAGVKRVWVASKDPNPLVSGRGIKRLQAAGIDVHCGLLEAEATRLNEGFFKRMTSGRPWVRLKTGASLDGHTALSNGESQWITSADAREDVQHLRARSSAVLTGVDTVLADDPLLTVRSEAVKARSHGVFRQPLRVVLDRRLRIPNDCQLLREAADQVLIVTTPEAMTKAPEKARFVSERVGLLAIPAQAGLGGVLDALGERGCNEVLVEAGARLIGAFLTEGLWDEYWLYLAPRLLGPGGRDMALVPRVEALSDTLNLSVSDLGRVGPDIRLILTPAPVAGSLN